MVFADRDDAGRRLAARLGYLRGEPVVVLGLPRGGQVGGRGGVMIWPSVVLARLACRTPGEPADPGNPGQRSAGADDGKLGLR